MTARLWLGGLVILLVGVGIGFLLPSDDGAQSPAGLTISYPFITEDWEVPESVTESGGVIADGVECLVEGDTLPATFLNESDVVIGAELQPVSGVLIGLPEDLDLLSSTTAPDTLFLCRFEINVPLSSTAAFYQLSPPFNGRNAISHAEAIEFELLLTDAGTVTTWES